MFSLAHLKHLNALSLTFWSCASLAVVGGCHDSSSSGPAARPAPLVVVQKIQRRDVPIEARAPVDLKPLADVDVGAKTLGYLDAVFVDRGDRVRKGQVLAIVRPSDLPDQLAGARGQLAQTQASATLARTNLERARALAPQAVVSRQELQAAESQLASAEATEQGARAQMAALAVRLGETRILSPLEGVVLMRRLDPGALVGPPGGGVILTVARVDVLRASIDVNERDTSGLALGKEAHVELDALPGRRFVGKVSRMAPAFDLATRTLQIEVQLDNRGGELRPGMYGRGAIVRDVHRQAMVVPVGAIQMSNRKTFAFVVDGDVVRRSEVQLGVNLESSDGSADGELVEVLSGVAPDASLVTAGIDNLADGMKVRTTPDASPSTGTAPKRPDAGQAGH